MPIKRKKVIKVSRHILDSLGCRAILIDIYRRRRVERLISTKG